METTTGVDYDMNDDTDLDIVEHDDIVEVRSTGRRAVSSGEPSLDGSIDVDEERGALSDSDITHAARSTTIAAQVKGPSSDALEESCKLESAGRDRGSDWEDVLGSGTLLKKILVAGSGHNHGRPKDGQYVTVKIIDTLRGIDSHETLKFILGYSMVIDAWELIVKLMVEGETCAVRAKARLAYGECGLDDTIPPDQDQGYTIELVEIGESPKFTAMDEQELSDFVLMLKERGNFYFARKEYEKAIFVYKRATSIVEVPDESEPLRKLFSALHSNLAVCYSKLGDTDMVLSCADESLRLHSANTKALFRRSLALSSRKEYDEAADCLRTALEIEPDDIAFQTELDRLSGLRRRHRQDERLLYKKMLAGAGGDSSADGVGTGWHAATAWLSANWVRASVAGFCLVTFIFFLYFLAQM